MHGSALRAGHYKSYRDDLEAVAYCLIYCMTGTLPWMNCLKEQQAKLDEMKLNMTEADLRGCPPLFWNFLQQTRKLPHKMLPDYSGLRRPFAELHKSLLDSQYDRFRFRLSVVLM